MISSRVNRKPDNKTANNKLAREPSKKIRSIQYSTSHTAVDRGTAECVHRFLDRMLQNSAPPATVQPAPVMDKYHGLRRAPNWERTLHQLNAAKKRSRPHADRLNTIQRNSVTPKGRFRGKNRSSNSESASGCV